MSNVTVYGGTGFVGSTYLRHHGGVLQSRDRALPTGNGDIMYFISTTHNYHVKDGDVHKDIDTNLTHLVEVLDLWRKFKFNEYSVFNFISSWFVYGGVGRRHNVGELEYCDPRGFYSITKRAAEQLLISYCETYGLKYRILRLGNVIGPGDKNASSRKNALQWMVNEMKADHKVQVYGHGIFYRDWIHVEDVVNAIELARTKGKVNYIYNVGNGKPWEFIDIIRYCQDKLGKKDLIEFKEPPSFHGSVQLSSFYMDSTKVWGDCGYIAKYTQSDLFDQLLV